MFYFCVLFLGIMSRRYLIVYCTCVLLLTCIFIFILVCLCTYTMIVVFIAYCLLEF